MEIQSKKLSLTILPLLYVIFLLLAFNYLPNGPYIYSKVLSFKSGAFIFYEHYLILALMPLIANSVKWIHRKLFLIIYSIFFLLYVSAQSQILFKLVLLYSACAFALILSILYKTVYKRTTFFLTYFALVVGSAYLHSLESSEPNTKVLISFVAFDSLIAWTWLYVQAEFNNDSDGQALSDLFLYLFAPFFFIRRLAISFSEYKKALNEEKKHETAIYLGWITIFRSTAIYLAFISMFSYLTRHVSLEVIELTSFFIIAYQYNCLSAGLIMTLGYRIREPFDNFLFSVHPLDFWRRWNIYMRDWLTYFYFFPALKKIKIIELSLLYTFFMSGIYHMFRFIIINKTNNLDFMLKFWIPGVFLSIFSFFYIRMRGLFYNLSQLQKKTIYLVGIITFWISYFYIRNIVIFCSNYLFELFKK